MLVVITGIASLAAIAGELVMVQDMHDLIRAAPASRTRPKASRPGRVRRAALSAG
jgi:hypothetical protein